MTSMRPWVLDTNILVSYYCFGGKVIPRVVEHALDNKLLAFSEATFQEFEIVLCRAKFDSRATLKERFAAVEQLRQAGRVFPLRRALSILQDSGDNRFLEAAEAADAEYLVTGDKALRSLAVFGATEIISPSALYERMAF